MKNIFEEIFEIKDNKIELTTNSKFNEEYSNKLKNLKEKITQLPRTRESIDKNLGTLISLANELQPIHYKKEIVNKLKKELLEKKIEREKIVEIDSMLKLVKIEINIKNSEIYSLINEIEEELKVLIDYDRRIRNMTI